MTTQSATQETSVDNTAAQDSNLWEELLARLQNSAWIDEVVVREEWQSRVRKLGDSPTRENIQKIRLLSKLRLALVQIQIRSAPDAYELSESEYVRNEHANDMLRFLGTDVFPQQGEIVVLRPEEMEQMKELESEMATKSIAAVESQGLGMVWLAQASRRLARPHARVFRLQKAAKQQSELLQASELPCSGAPIRSDVFENDWALLAPLSSRVVD